MPKASQVARDQVRGAKVGWRVSGVLADLALERCGRDVTRMYRVLSYVGGWGLFFDANGRGPETDREYSAGVGVSLGSAHRWRVAFDETFPELESPAFLWEQIRAGVKSSDLEVVAIEVGASDVDMLAGQQTIEGLEAIYEPDPQARADAAVEQAELAASVEQARRAAILPQAMRSHRAASRDPQ